MLVTASIISAPLLELGDVLERLRESGVDALHIDVEDGHFVPELGLGLRVVEDVAAWGGLPVDVHLMVADPEFAIARLRGLPLRSVAIHLEATRYPRRVLRQIREAGWRAGLAVNPVTSLPELGRLAPHLDYVLQLTTEPEPDPDFLTGMLATLPASAAAARAVGVELWVDGGVSEDNAESLAAMGVDSVVVGRALIDSADPGGLVQLFAGGSGKEDG